MLYLACYDIEDSKVRLRVANCLLASGLERVQRSVFVGSLDRSLYDQVVREIGQHLTGTDATTTQFMLMPLAEAYARNAHWIGDDPPDWPYHLNKTLTLIF